MLQFHHPERLWALALLLPLAALALAARRWERRRRAALSDAHLAAGLWTDGRGATGGGFLRPALMLGALAFCIGGWAGPFSPGGGAVQRSSNTDVFIALDASRSMRATDLQPDRLSRATSFINRLAERLPDARLGLIVFAGRAYLQVPLTTDRAAFRMALGAVRPENLPAQGTVLSSAISLATSSFSQKERRAKALVLVTDGEDHDDAAADAVKKAVQSGVVLHAVGVGSPAGAPLYEGAGQPKLDETGVPVVTKLDETGLQKLVRGSGGDYVRLRDAASAASSVADAVQSRGGAATAAENSAGNREYFQLLLAAALVLLLASGVRRPARTALRAAALLAICLLPALTGHAQRAQLQAGDAHYRAGRWAEAAAAYRKALNDSATRATAQYNLGNALYQQQQWEAAQQAYGAAGANGSLRSRAAYNTGNAHASKRQWREAIASYQDALRATPGAADAQYNLSYALKQLAKENASQKNQQQQQPKPQPSQQQQQKQPQQPDPGALSKAQAEKLLQALRNEERRILNRQQRNAATTAQPEKDW